jgi:hypothetical protein
MSDTKYKTRLRLRVFNIEKEKLYFLNVDYSYNSMTIAKQHQQSTYEECEEICATLALIAKSNGLDNDELQAIVIPLVDYMYMNHASYDRKEFKDDVPRTTALCRMIEITNIYKYLGDIKTNTIFSDYLKSKDMLWGI